MPEPPTSRPGRLVLEGSDRDLRVILAELQKVFDSDPEMMRLANRIEARMEDGGGGALS